MFKTNLTIATFPLLLTTVFAQQQPEVRETLIDRPPITSSGLWTDAAPAGCPFPKSTQFEGLEFTGRYAYYAFGDTWYPTWAADDRMYSPYTDGGGPGGFSGSGYGFENLKSPVTGFAVIEGSDPLKLQFPSGGVIPHEPFPYGGQYPCGTLVINGIWYYGSYALDWSKGRAPWDILGPFVGFNISTNYGQTWLPETRTALNPIFGESGKDGSAVQMFRKTPEYEAWIAKNPGKSGGKVKIGAPHFVDFGKNMEHSLDGKAYLVAHGSVRPEAFNSWSSGDQVYLLRVLPSIETINDPKAYEFYAGQDAQGQPVWTREFTQMKPLLEWNRNMGIVTATYVPGLKKFLMCLTDGHGPNASTYGPYHTYILESAALTGPWKRVTYMKEFGKQAYFVNFPSKFISPDGRTLWMSYSGGWHVHTPNPAGGRYGLTLQEVRLVDVGNPAGVKPYEFSVGTVPEAPQNVARLAKVTASSQAKTSPAVGAINGRVGGRDLTGDDADEWMSEKEGAGAWLRLAWDMPQRVNRVWLFDGPYRDTQVKEAELHFSDGSSIAVGELPSDASQGRQIEFPSKTVTWMEVRITKTLNKDAALSEVAVFKQE